MTTVAVQPMTVVAQPATRVGWREIAQVFWLERRGASLGFAGLLAAFAIAIVIGEHSTAASYGRYVADGCVQHPNTYACETNDFVNNSGFIPSLRIAGDAIPAVIGMFLGAPLLAREYESGTFRFTWTQAVGRRRFVIRTLVLAALVVAAFGIVVGLLLDWVNHPFEVVAHMSQWTAGNFDAAPMLMAAWSVFGLFIGVLFGAVIGRRGRRRGSGARWPRDRCDGALRPLVACHRRSGDVRHLADHELRNGEPGLTAGPTLPGFVVRPSVVHGTARKCAQRQSSDARRGADVQREGR